MDAQKVVDVAKDYTHKAADFLTELEQVLDQVGPVLVALVGLFQSHFAKNGPPTEAQ